MDGEMVCLSLEGLALVAEGDVDEGMRRLDEATAAAMADEVTDARLVELICCHLIDACKRVRDLGRAAEWCRRVEEVATRYRDAEMFATCRTQYGEVLVWRGAWADAEQALTSVCRDFRAVRRPVIDALVRLAELRRRQGRTKEATALLAEAHEHRLAPLVTGWLALDEGSAERAAGEAERFLRRVGRGASSGLPRSSFSSARVWRFVRSTRLRRRRPSWKRSLRRPVLLLSAPPRC